MRVGQIDMNAEEAAEVILEGIIWRDCLFCNGGVVKNDGLYRRCDVCNGKGQKVCKRYVMACEVLCMPIPKLPVKYMKY